MEKTLQMFESLCSRIDPVDTPIVLFLTHVDILDAKIKSGVRVSQEFRDYPYDLHRDTKRAIHFMKDKFLEKQVDTRLKIYPIAANVQGISH
jgi:hypothetical protein